MKRLLSIGLTILFIFCAFGCTASTQENDAVKQMIDYKEDNQNPTAGGTLRLALSGATSLNPILSTNNNNLYVLKLIYDGLFQRTENDTVEPLLCESYTLSPDGLTYEFTIREGIAFHNGAAFSSGDVKGTLDLIFSTDNLYKDRLSSINTYRAEGRKVIITLSKPIINFPALLDFPILSKGDLNGKYDVSSYVPNGTGRFKVQSYKKSKELHLSANQNYFKPFTPNIQSVCVYLLKDNQAAISMLENLQIDLLTSDILNPGTYTPKRTLSSVRYSCSNFTFIGLNNQRPALLNPITRKALNNVLNRDDILENCTIPYARATDIPFPTGSYWHLSQETPVATKEESIATLYEAGWRDSDNNTVLDQEIYGEKTELKLEILVNSNNSTRVKIAEQVRKAWQEMGVPVIVTAVPYETYSERIENKEYDVFIGGSHLSENYDLSFMLRTDENVFGISSESIDQTLNALLLMDTEPQKQALYYELCDVLRRDRPIIGLYFENDLLIFDERIKGSIHPSQSDIFYDFERWFISQ